MAKIPELHERLLKMFDESNNVKTLIAKERGWDSASDLIRGKQLPANRPDYKPEAVLNLLRPLIERKSAMLTDTKPRFTIQPTKKGDGHAAAAKLLDETANAWWDDSCVDLSLMRGSIYAQAFGTMITQLRWSLTQKDAVLDIIDPRNFYVDPYILTSDQLANAEYVILEETPPLEEVKMMFPKTSGTVQAYFPPAQSKDGWVSRVVQRVTGPFRQRTETTAIPRALLRHYWVKDYAFEDVEVKKAESDQPPMTVRRRLYPGGRYIVWAFGGEGGTILHDKPNPYADLVHPFDMMDWYMDLDGPWGDSEVQTHRSPQFMLNKVAESVIENAMLMNNAIWIADKTAFPATEGPDGWGQLRNAPGAIIKKRPGTEVRREYPGGLPGSVMQLMTYLQTFIEAHGGGLPDILSRGKAGNVQSGLGIEQLQMSASAMIRLKARALENLIQRIGQKYVSRVFQFYPKERVFHIRGPGGEFAQFVFMKDQLRQALGTEALQDFQRDFRFRVMPGSSLAMTKIQKGLVALQLYQAGAIDRQALLESIEWPDWERVLQRTKLEQAMGLEPAGGQKKSKRGYGPQERQAKIAGRI